MTDEVKLIETLSELGLQPKSIKRKDHGRSNICDCHYKTVTCTFFLIMLVSSFLIVILSDRAQYPKDVNIMDFAEGLVKFRAMARTYGEYFAQSEEAIIKATEDVLLWRDVSSILGLNESLVDWEELSHTNWEVISPHSKVIRLTHIFGEHYFQTEKMIQKASINKTLEEDVKRILLLNQLQRIVETKTNPKDDCMKIQHPSALSKGPQSLRIFLEEFTFESVNDNSKRSNSSSNRTAILDLWDYFVNDYQNGNLTELKNTTTMDSEKYEKPTRLSQDKKFLLYDSIIKGSNFQSLSMKSNLTAVTQTSIDRFPMFVDTYSYWNGPISISIFLLGPMEYFTLKSYLAYLRRCHELFMDRVVFSFATLVDYPIPIDSFIMTTDFDEIKCSANRTIIDGIFGKRISRTIQWLTQSEGYPQNMMRNLACDNIKTEYQIVLDVDIIPCPMMFEKLEEYLYSIENMTEATSLVIPTYEISHRAKFPQNKNELIKLVKRGQAQPFHNNIYLPNQNATNFRKWQLTHDSFGPVHIVHTVKPYPLHYEPFFVEKKFQKFDERFIGYGFTRSSYAFLNSKLSTDFQVLSPIFTAELGIRKVKDWSEERQRQNEHNRVQFETLLKTFD